VDMRMDNIDAVSNTIGENWSDDLRDLRGRRWRYAVWVVPIALGTQKGSLGEVVDQDIF